MVTTGKQHSPKSQLYARLGNVSLSEEQRFRRRLAKAKNVSSLAAIAQDLERAEETLRQKIERLPEITYPDQLPVSARRDDIARAIREHQIVIIAGETGSGKTTQIPKICLELGRGRRGMIGHTQPRRLAARTVAERIADELGEDIGQTVGYAIRFDDKVGNNTAIKLMTDGILLADLQRDRWLNDYDTIIIDEAHERSLNIDFLLGYLKQLTAKRKDLKVIITSATIDPERFAQHFHDADMNPAPIIEVSGRTYPVEIRYRPLEAEVGEKTVDIDPIDGLLQALEELMSCGEGDILCFFAGEADIREAMEAIKAKRWKNVEVTPLFGRLSNQEQHRVFQPHACRRIVLATNIAETSLTVPGIHYVVDTGTARISRYSTRSKVQRLPIEPISQASANQRSGRCGRVADGIAIRLYSEEDFLSRPAFTDPEILRTNLANVILQMASLRLGDIEAFPFVQKPDTRAVRDGIALLSELGALEDPSELRLTPVGKTLARIPLDPRMGRMLIEGHRLGCLNAVYVIVAALSIQDVRERPLDYQAQADQQHARFKDKTSDFLSYLNLWNYLKTQREKLSGNAFKRQVTQEFLHYMRIREWWDLVRQLRNIGDQIGWAQALDQVDSPDEDAIHQALLSGLLSHIGARIGDTQQFRGSRNTTFMVFPGSALAKKPPELVMAAELVETSRLWARDVARISPAWVERIAGGLLKHQYSDPHWSTKRGCAMVYQHSTLYGVPVIQQRLTSFHVVDPGAARDMFIRHALIYGEWNEDHDFLKENQLKLEDASLIEEKMRRRDLLVDEQDLFDFYDQRLPEKVVNAITFNRWWKGKRQHNPRLLDFVPEDLVSDEEFSEHAFPDHWRQGSLNLALSYVFEPGASDDGVSVHIPVPALGTITDQGFEWLVPGLREDLIIELIRSLPKHLRKHFVPAPETAAQILPDLSPEQGELRVLLAHALTQLRPGHRVDPSDFDFHKLPEHLRMRFAAVDKRGKIIDSDRDLRTLKQRRKKDIQSSVSRVSAAIEQESAKEWTAQTLGTLQDQVITKVDGQAITTYPTLVVTKDGVAVAAVPTKAEAEQSLRTACLTMLIRNIPVNAQKMLNGLPLQQRVGVENYPHQGAAGFVNDCRVAVIRDLLMEHGGFVRSPEEFAALEATIRPQVPGLVRQAVVALAPGITAFVALAQQLDSLRGTAIEDIRSQLSFLLPAHAVSKHGVNNLRHLPRYMQAIKLRLEAAQLEPAKDQDIQDRINDLEDALEHQVQTASHPVAVKDIQRIRWMLQELRVSLFAQRLGTAYSISERKVSKAIQAL